ncbi:unnamed protein product, partial [Amoebophrya sp. A25]|eukprot:GSA25T00022739001.1
MKMSLSGHLLVLVLSAVEVRLSSAAYDGSLAVVGDFVASLFGTTPFCARDFHQLEGPRRIIGRTSAGSSLDRSSLDPGSGDNLVAPEELQGGDVAYSRTVPTVRPDSTSKNPSSPNVKTSLLQRHQLSSSVSTRQPAKSSTASSTASTSMLGEGSLGAEGSSKTPREGSSKTSSRRSRAFILSSSASSTRSSAQRPSVYSRAVRNIRSCGSEERAVKNEDLQTSRVQAAAAPQKKF